MDVETHVAGFVDGLLAQGPHPSLGRHADTYGRLIGSWAGEFEDRAADGTPARGRMEVHFAWVLDGRAVQDLWIAPTLAERRAGGERGKRDTYGTTLRVFDPATESWRVLWLNPASGVRNDLIARRVGDDIVQPGFYKDVPVKWVFSDITRDSFVWRGFSLEADGTTWRLETEFRLTRTR